MKDRTPLKAISMNSQSGTKAYLTRPPEDTHTKEELRALHNAIHFTHNFMSKESLAKIDIPEGMKIL